ncbi:hypothetical protein TRFO_35073 [Tritrichomonas foetus]|uniref:Uncharacterized protein n=1 Tax=Tritrichomonas foetus TaxID=1144522 RepID=A0A1J4JH95_9EUKA|nr:hypothetical protein TRFO_35073 [Tritrichomonas foetus]|eukprot:OHS98502.1 hypothetical protein TRFO_35073 [Tritrichomonas foetus]
MDFADSLFQALIPSGKPLGGFEVPKSINNTVSSICSDHTNLRIFHDNQVELFSLVYKCCTVAYTCGFGVPKDLTNQAQIYKLTYKSSLIDFYFMLVQQCIDSIFAMCGDIRSFILNITCDSQSRDNFKSAVVSLNHQRSLIVIFSNSISFLCEKLTSFVQIPSITAEINSLSNELQKLVQMSDELHSTIETSSFCSEKADKTTTNNINVCIYIKNIDILCKQICTEFIPRISTFRQASISQLKSQFSQHYSKQYQKYIDYASSYTRALINLISLSFKSSIFSRFDSSTFAIAYKLSKECLTFITQFHKLLRFRCHYELAIVTLKLSHQEIHEITDQLAAQIRETLQYSPFSFQNESNNFLYRLQNELKGYDLDFDKKTESLMKRLKSSKKFIVFTPITSKHLKVSPLSTLSINFQKYIYMIAHSLIKNHYPASLFDGMTRLTRISYEKLYDLLKSQVSSKTSNDQRISYIHKLDNIEYALTLFIATFSLFSDETIVERNQNDNLNIEKLENKSDDKTEDKSETNITETDKNEILMVKSALVALNLTSEVCVFDSDPETTETLNLAFNLFISMLHNETYSYQNDKMNRNDNDDSSQIVKVTSSAIYLFYRRISNLAVFHNTLIVARFFKFLMKQLKYATDSKIENLEEIANLNKTLLRFMKSIQRNVFYDKSFTIPQIINDITFEQKLFINTLKFKSDHHTQTLNKSLENFNAAYDDLVFIYDHLNLVEWNLDINDFAQFISDAKCHLEKCANHVNSKDFSAEAFGLSQNLYEVVDLAKNISEIPESTISSIISATWNILEYSTEVSFNRKNIAEAAKIITQELDSLSSIVLLYSNESKSFTRVDNPMFTKKLKHNRSSLVKINKAYNQYIRSTKSSSQLMNKNPTNDNLLKSPESQFQSFKISQRKKSHNNIDDIVKDFNRHLNNNKKEENDMIFKQTDSAKSSSSSSCDSSSDDFIIDDDLDLPISQNNHSGSGNISRFSIRIPPEHSRQIYKNASSEHFENIDSSHINQIKLSLIHHRSNSTKKEPFLKPRPIIPLPKSNILDKTENTSHQSCKFDFRSFRNVRSSKTTFSSLKGIESQVFLKQIESGSMTPNNMLRKSVDVSNMMNSEESS